MEPCMPKETVEQIITSFLCTVRGEKSKVNITQSITLTREQNLFNPLQNHKTDILKIFKGLLRDQKSHVFPKLYL